VSSLVTAIARLAILPQALLTLGGPSRRRRGRVADVREPTDSTTTDADGAVRSVQTADLFLPTASLDEIWTPMHLERLARTYWRFLSRITLGAVRVRYTEHERYVVAVFPFVRLLTFSAPEYEMDAERGFVRWRIERGVLVARHGRGAGRLQIDVRRSATADPAAALLHVRVEVSNFYPAIASRISRRVYDATQSRIHVIVTHAFLRSLARLDLAPSRVGRFAHGPAVVDGDRLRAGPAA
jgi:hypothetical protein